MNRAADPPYDDRCTSGSLLDRDQPADGVWHRLIGLTKLMEITRRLAAQTELGSILEIITEGACQALECERASLIMASATRVHTPTTA